MTMTKAKKLLERQKRAKEYAAIIGKSEEECNNNIMLLDRYSKYLKLGVYHYIELVLSEGKWNNIEEDSLKQEEDLLKQEAESKIKHKAEEDSLEQEEDSLKQEETESKIKHKAEEKSIANLMLMLKTIREIGSLEEAGKMFDLAERVLEEIREEHH